MQCDGYSAYPSFAKRSGGRIALAACWAYARRKFHEAAESAPQRAGWVLLQIQHLHRIEKHLRETKPSPRQRQALRSSQSRMITERIHQAITRLKLSRDHLPRSAMGRAIDYTLTMWPMLTVYLEDGRIEPERSGDSQPQAARRVREAKQIDNTPVENAIRPTGIGKKNWLFIGEAEAGQRSAVLFTIIEACRSRGIDPKNYLRDELTRLPTLTNWQIKEVTPAAWTKAQHPADQRHAA